MKCPYCNQDHPDDFQFCPKTGKRIENQNKACTNEQCSAYGKYVLPQDAKFCPNCGCAIAAEINEEHNVEEKKKNKPSEVEIRVLDSEVRRKYGISLNEFLKRGLSRSSLLNVFKI